MAFNSPPLPSPYPPYRGMLSVLVHVNGVEEDEHTEGASQLVSGSTRHSPNFSDELTNPPHTDVSSFRITRFTCDVAVSFVGLDHWLL